MNILKPFVAVQAVGSVGFFIWALSQQNGMAGLGIVLMMTAAVSYLATLPVWEAKTRTESGAIPNPKAAAHRDFQ